MHKVAIYRRYAYQSPNHRPRWSFVLTILRLNGNKHEIVFHNPQTLNTMYISTGTITINADQKLCVFLHKNHDD